MSTSGPSLEESLSNLDSPQGRSFPSPPHLHWTVLLVTAFVLALAGAWLNTLGVGSPWIRDVLSARVILLTWLLVQASFVQKLSNKNYLLTTAAAGLLAIVPILLIHTGRVDAHSGTSFLPVIAAVLLWMDLFRMKDFLEHHYTSIEQYGLSMVGMLLFFLGPVYLQYHFRRIALWKKQQTAGVIA